MMADLRYLLDHAKKQGAREAELYLEESGSWNCRVYQGQIEELQASASNGLGVRVLVGDSLGIAYTSDLRREGCLEAAERAVANARVSAPDSLREFFAPDPDTKYAVLSIWDDQLEKVPSEEKIHLALDMEEMAKKKDPLIQKVLGTGVSTSSRKVTVLNTRGVNASCRSNSARASASVLAASSGVMQSGGGSQFARTWTELDPATVVEEAVHHAVSLVGGQQVESQDAEVIFDRGIAAIIWGMLGRTLTGEEVQKKRSMFAGKVGQKVASDLVSLIDDPLRPDGPGASPFDAEGVPRRTFPLVEDGVLKGFMYDLYSARKDGIASTGHASRSFRSPVNASPANLYLKPSSTSLDEIVASTRNGLLVMEVKGIGTGGLNPVSGDLSVGASGLWISGGKFTGPVREVTIAGNLKDILLSVDAVASDFKWSGTGTPAFRVKKMAVSGK